MIPSPILPARAFLAMLTNDQIQFFQTFGFLCLRQFFSQAEIDSFAREAESFWEQHDRRGPDESRYFHGGRFIEQRDRMRHLPADDRIYVPLKQLLGGDFIWAGSECNHGMQTGTNAHHWHADRPGTRELSYARIKIMLYLDPMRPENGALRVIPGSHRLPLHEDLQAFQDRHEESDPTFFGLRGEEIPCQILTTDPGDLLMFNHCLFHSVYAKSGRRRYIALKFAARPTCDAHLDSLRKFQPDTFEPHDGLLTSSNPRIRRMVQGLAELGSTG
jgi:hypothetical protein